MPGKSLMGAFRLSPSAVPDDTILEGGKLNIHRFIFPNMNTMLAYLFANELQLPYIKSTVAYLLANADHSTQNSGSKCRLA